MVKVFPGRYTAAASDGLVVFAIGMRINRLFAVHRWLRPTINTVRMWRYMQRRRPPGYLNGYVYVYWRGVGMMQYWQDFESLEAFSRDATQPHLAAWRQLASQTTRDQTFGYWHETYRVSPGSHEAIYGSMPRFGLAAAAEHIPISGATESAKGRLESGTTST
jgi:Domain of unknown function (DUF4188)